MSTVSMSLSRSRLLALASGSAWLVLGVVELMASAVGGEDLWCTVGGIGIAEQDLVRGRRRKDTNAS